MVHAAHWHVLEVFLLFYYNCNNFHTITHIKTSFLTLACLET